MIEQRINYIPDVMSNYDCMMLTRLNTINKLNTICDFIECDGEVVCCRRGDIVECDEVYVY